VVGEPLGVLALVPAGAATAVEHEYARVWSLADALEQPPGEPVGAHVLRTHQSTRVHGESPYWVHFNPVGRTLARPV
jgi:hypothetical protein